MNLPLSRHRVLPSLGPSPRNARSPPGPQQRRFHLCSNARPSYRFFQAFPGFAEVERREVVRQATRPVGCPEAHTHRPRLSGPESGRDGLGAEARSLPGEASPPASPPESQPSHRQSRRGGPGNTDRFKGRQGLHVWGTPPGVRRLSPGTVAVLWT